MNFALNLACKVQERLAQIERQGWTDVETSTAYKETLRQVVNEDKLAWAGGDIRIGDIILLIDADTRVPRDCLLDAAIEFDKFPDVAILQHKSSFIRIEDNYLERGIVYFNELIYASITFAAAAGKIRPFLGYYMFQLHIANLSHNAFIRWSALEKMSWVEDGLKKWWSEVHVSEDFERSLRLQIAGWQVQYANYYGDEFQEGASLTLYDEVKRWQKYGYGSVCTIFTRLMTGGTYD
jgi:membrane glycosyltransferase